MSEFLGALLFIAFPFVLGYATASYLAALLPVASLMASVLNYWANPPAAIDEVDVLSGLWIVGSVLALGLCLVGALLARRARRCRGVKTLVSDAGRPMIRSVSGKYADVTLWVSASALVSL